MFLAIIPAIATIIVAAVGAATSVASIAIKASPTNADKYRKQRIKTLQGKEQRGDLGYTNKQIEELQALGMSPVNAAAREQYSRAGDQLATKDIGSGATYIQRAMVDASIQDAARKVGDTVIRADIQEAARQKDELLSLLSKQEQSQKQKQNEWGNFIADIGSGAVEGIGAVIGEADMAGNLKNALGGNVSPDADTLKAAGWTEDDIRIFKQLSPEQQQTFLSSLK